MNNKSLLKRALIYGAGIALGTIAVAAQADPFTVQGTCTLSSIIAGQGVCRLTYVVTDDSTTLPAIVYWGLAEIDGVVVAQYNNDGMNPYPFAVSSVSASVQVACGAAHTVKIYVRKVALPGSYTGPVGALRPVLCPAGVPLT